MTERFLHAKHWQLFVLIFGIPMVFQFLMMASLITQTLNAGPTEPFLMFEYIKFFPLMILIPLGVLFGWFWSITIGLQKKIPSDVVMKINKFKLFFFIPVIYILIFLMFFIYISTSLLVPNAEPNIGLVGSIFTVIVPIHLFSMFCIFYTIYFVAKTIKTVELKREVKFGDFAGEFFLLWFYPVGVWILQPKLNKMIKEA